MDMKYNSFMRVFPFGVLDKWLNSKKRNKTLYHIVTNIIAETPVLEVDQGIPMIQQLLPAGVYAQTAGRWTRS